MQATWDEQLSHLPEDKQKYYTELKEKALSIAQDGFPIRETNALFIQPEELDWVYLRVCFGTDSHRLTAYKIAWYEEDLKRLKRRVKNPIKIWYPRANLHMRDTVTNKLMKMRMIEVAGYQYGA
jgi:hypothetical protein